MHLIKKIVRGIYKFIDKRIILPVTKFFVFIAKKLKIADKPFEMFLKTKSISPFSVFLCSVDRVIFKGPQK